MDEYIICTCYIDYEELQTINDGYHQNRESPNEHRDYKVYGKLTDSCPSNDCSNHLCTCAQYGKLSKHLQEEAQKGLEREMPTVLIEKEEDYEETQRINDGYHQDEESSDEHQTCKVCGKLTDSCLRYSNSHRQQTNCNNDCNNYRKKENEEFQHSLVRKKKLFSNLFTNYFKS